MQTKGRKEANYQTENDMKTLLLLPLLLSGLFARGQDVIAQMANENKAVEPFTGAYQVHSTVATLAIGFADYYRANYRVPTGFQQNNTSGFIPVYGRLEYGLTPTVSIGAVFSYDAFYSNYYQLFEANNNIYKRNGTDRVRVFSGGLSGYYHFGELIKVKRLDAYAGIGFSLNNISHSALPQGDSMVAVVQHTVSPSIKVGARYYLTNRGSIFADAGYDRQSVVSVGFSCRFLSRKAAKN